MNISVYSRRFNSVMPHRVVNYKHDYSKVQPIV